MLFIGIGLFDLYHNTTVITWVFGNLFPAAP